MKNKVIQLWQKTALPRFKLCLTPKLKHIRTASGFVVVDGKAPINVKRHRIKLMLFTPTVDVYRGKEKLFYKTKGYILHYSVKHNHSCRC